MSAGSHVCGQNNCRHDCRAYSKRVHLQLSSSSGALLSGKCTATFSGAAEDKLAMVGAQKQGLGALSAAADAGASAPDAARLMRFHCCSSSPPQHLSPHLRDLRAPPAAISATLLPFLQAQLTLTASTRHTLAALHTEQCVSLLTYGTPSAAAACGCSSCALADSQPTLTASMRYMRAALNTE